MDNLSLMQEARIKQQLTKQARFKEGLFTYEDFFKQYVVKVESVISNNEDKFNRTKFNRMDNKEQDIYEQFLKREIIKYRAYVKDGSFFDINKLLFEGFKSLNNGLSININITGE